MYFKPAETMKTVVGTKKMTDKMVRNLNPDLRKAIISKSNVLLDYFNSHTLTPAVIAERMKCRILRCDHIRTGDDIAGDMFTMEFPEGFRVHLWKSAGSLSWCLDGSIVPDVTVMLGDEEYTIDLRTLKYAHDIIAVNSYFWNNSDLYKVVDEIANGSIHPDLNTDILVRELAKRVKAHITPYSDAKPVTDCCGDSICGERTAYYAMKLEDYLNNTIRDDKGFMRYVRTKFHRTIQQSLMTFVIKVIRLFASYTSHDIDGRNESAVAIAKKLAECLDENGYSEGLPLI